MQYYPSFRGAVGETTFHVCFLMGTPTHMYVSKRMLQWFPKLLHDIYLSEVCLHHAAMTL